MVKRNEKTYDTEPKPIIYDVRKNKQVKIKSDNSFELVGEDKNEDKNKNKNKVVFQIISADIKANTVTLLDTSTSMQFVLQQLSKEKLEKLEKAYQKKDGNDDDSSSSKGRSRNKNRNKKNRR